MTGQTGHSLCNVALEVCVYVCAAIPNPAKCEVRAVIRFLFANGETAAEMHPQLVSVYGEDVMNKQNVAK
jgi:hypothetical protein